MGAVGVVTSHVVHATGGPNAHGRGEFVCRSVMSLTKRRRVCVRKRERKREKNGHVKRGITEGEGRCFRNEREKGLEYEHGAILGHLKTLSSRPRCVTTWESFSEGGVRAKWPSQKRRGERKRASGAKRDRRVNFV